MNYNSHGTNTISIGCFDEFDVNRSKNLMRIFYELKKGTDCLYVCCFRLCSADESAVLQIIDKCTTMGGFENIEFDGFQLSFFVDANFEFKVIAKVLSELFFTFESPFFFFSKRAVNNEKVFQFLSDSVASSSLITSLLTGYVAYKEVEDDILWIRKSESESFECITKQLEQS
ncbi:hypothetical protein [Pseudoalteromonas luteoviolacea]|uniref:hypothetical protein n=1 Tax=Pseudoalteromonas luteoviolacea TaxID=43657 RepID=UPI0011514140|nr:hypothetical protein [Pseudoalteromonas luteoviolacea]TQF70191.1 hypothetical protein FLM44_03625 [Pseudoalteromonas luteoviolacea]